MLIASCALALAFNVAPVRTARAHVCYDARTAPSVSGPWGSAERARTAASRAMRCVVGHLRRRHRLAPLRWSPRLAQAARRHARDMVGRRYFSHTTPEGGELLDRLRRYAEPARAWWIGEVLAWGAGPASRPIDVLRRWLDSPPHRRILLAPRAREIGIGIALGAPVRRPARGSATFVIELGWRAAGVASAHAAIDGGSNRMLRRQASGWLCSDRTGRTTTYRLRPRSTTASCVRERTPSFE